MVKGAVESANRLNPVARKQQPGTGIMAELNEKSELTEEQFVDLLKKIDNGLRALPATAQVGWPPSYVMKYGSELRCLLPFCLAIEGHDYPQNTLTRYLNSQVTQSLE